VRKSDDGETVFFSPKERVILLVIGVGLGGVSYYFQDWFDTGDAPLLLRLPLGLALGTALMGCLFAAIVGGLSSD
jgi:H+/Cl- antiporter ClcA